MKGEFSLQTSCEGSNADEERFMTAVFESSMFKSVPGGYIFQSRPPTIFHSTPAYVVNEEQKAQILAIIRAGLRMQTIIASLAGLVVGASGPEVMRHLGVPVIVGIGAGACVFFALLIVLNSLHFHLRQRRLEPVLAGLPRSNERLFPESDPYGAPTPLWGLIWCTGMGTMLGYVSAKHLPFTELGSTLSLILTIGTLAWCMVGVSRTEAKAAKSGSADPAVNPPPRWGLIWCTGMGIMLGYVSAEHLPFTDRGSTLGLIIVVGTLASCMAAASRAETNATKPGSADPKNGPSPPQFSIRTDVTAT